MFFVPTEEEEEEEESKNADDVGVDYLLTDLGDETSKASQSPTKAAASTPQATAATGDKDSPDELTDIAGLAESIQPKGYTLETAQVGWSLAVF